MGQEPRTVFLWTTPRSLSTVFTKCISFVDNVQIWFEPYGCAFGNKIYHSIKDNLKSEMNDSSLRGFVDRQDEEPTSTFSSSRNWFEEDIMTYPWVKAQLETPDPKKPFRFIKNMAYNINGDINFEYLPDIKCQHTFLIRNPLRIYSSCKVTVAASKASSNGFDDIDLKSVNLVKHFPYFPINTFYDTLYKLWRAVKTMEGRVPVVIDAEELCNKPDILLGKYFEAVGLPWSEKYLSWDASGDITKEWKTSKERMNPHSKIYKVWYKTAIESSRFIPTEKRVLSVDELPRDLRECASKAMPLYKEMFESRTKVNDLEVAY
ncbi:hypothetical protein HOLleu_03464 [Holothuria leucospilota]|uniref:Sulfotransferase family protein n=1 Tax=Holothuria leucospilota TaxID=206669 RepID=A0A9Q1HLU7_HOLLE|nr:hypothetical protein HOLleu_03464 [Holothuria leucospilota]